MRIWKFNQITLLETYVFHTGRFGPGTEIFQGTPNGSLKEYDQLILDMERTVAKCTLVLEISSS